MNTRRAMAAAAGARLVTPAPGRRIIWAVKEMSGKYLGSHRSREVKLQ
jgi:hypothetical protein